MIHARAAIRAAAVAAVTGLPTTGARVVSGRIFPVTEVPALSVHTNDDFAADDEGGGHMGEIEGRTCTLVVTALAKKTTGLDDVLDTIAAEIEQAIVADRTLNGSCSYVKYSTMDTDYDDDDEVGAGIMTMAFAADYRIDPSAPDAHIP